VITVTRQNGEVLRDENLVVRRSTKGGHEVHRHQSTPTIKSKSSHENHRLHSSLPSPLDFNQLCGSKKPRLSLSSSQEFTSETSYIKTSEFLQGKNEKRPAKTVKTLSQREAEILKYLEQEILFNMRCLEVESKTENIPLKISWNEFAKSIAKYSSIMQWI
jgi:hypothetical protein